MTRSLSNPSGRAPTLSHASHGGTGAMFRKDNIFRDKLKGMSI